MKSPYVSFLEIWQQCAYYLFIISIVAAFLIFVIYKITVLTKSDLKNRYDFISINEIKYYLLSQIAIGSFIFFLLNYIRIDVVKLDYIWFFVRLFTSLCIATLYIYIMVLILKYYYPRPLEKKLNRLRYTPRVNPANGNKMKLLSEEEEDVYLDEGMQAEENVFSVDYDVWVDPKSEYVKIEKYKGHLTALECDRCGLQTLKLSKEEIIKQPSAQADGEIKKEFVCSYCNRIRREVVRLNRTASPEYSAANPNLLIDNPLDGKVIPISVNVEIFGNNGNKKNYHFQTTKDASKFLGEFDFKKLEEDSISD